jgi:rhamnose transport system ATP-binding protein
LAALGVRVDTRGLTRGLPPDLRQLVEIARALSYDSRILLLDEPTSTLDLEETDRLMATLRRLADDGLSVVIVSHRMSEIMSVSDRFTVLRDGRLIGSRTRADGVDEDWLVRSMVGRELHRVQVGAPPATSPDHALEVTDIQDRAGSLQRISFTVGKGEIVGLAGLVGAGRTELLETIMGHRPRRHGEVRVDGKLVHPRVRESLRAGMALVAEDRKAQALLPGRAIDENATLTLPLGRGLVRRSKQDVASALPWIQRFDTKYASLKQPISSLSGGNQQKVLLARAMVIAPSVLLLDEPTRGIDLGAKQRIYEEIIALAASGIGVVVASSELPEIISLCHRTLVIREGSVVKELTSSESTEESIVSAATGAMTHV